MLIITFCRNTVSCVEEKHNAQHNKSVNIPSTALHNQYTPNNTPVNRLVISVRDEAIEIVVLLLSNGCLLFGPDRLHHVHRLAIHFNRESHEGRVALDNAVGKCTSK